VESHAERELLMKGGDLLGLLLVGTVGLIVINEISKAKACGPACQVILSDARGTLVQDLVTGFIKWV
jgi:hypothetical protein